MKNTVDLLMAFAACFTILCPAEAAAQEAAANVAIQWNQAALQGVRDSKLGPPMVSRALAIVHTCMYDAWAAYDPVALGTHLAERSARRRPRGLAANRAEAVSFAAFRALADLFPQDENAVFLPLMQRLGYEAGDRSADPTTPSGVGNLACAAVLRYRHEDGSNQLGNLTPGGVAYADYTDYRAVNSPSKAPVDTGAILDPNRWQPLEYADASGAFVTQQFVGAQWYKVTPFALRSGDEFRGRLALEGPALYGSPEFREEAAELVSLSAGLTDEQKMMAEYWADGPHSELPPGHWNLFAQYVSARDQHTLDDDVKLLFALTNAIFDAGIVAWDAKRAFDSARPETSLPFMLQGQVIESWGGPGKRTALMDGRYWIPYQASTFPTPPFPEFVSGHSSFSAAGAEILRLFTGSDRFGASVTLQAGTSKIESGITPSTRHDTALEDLFGGGRPGGLFEAARRNPLQVGGSGRQGGRNGSRPEGLAQGCRVVVGLPSGTFPPLILIKFSYLLNARIPGELKFNSRENIPMPLIQ